MRIVQERLASQAPTAFPFRLHDDLKHISAVLFLLGRGRDGKPELILNKRSQQVRQSGDLCCPGGGISPLIDSVLARWLRLPATPLHRWAQRPWWRHYRKHELAKIALLLAAALREGLEEMGLNPLGVEFLGPLAAQRLVLFKREIFPLVGWVARQRRFFPNWEVEKIIRIPLATLLNVGNYACYRISIEGLPHTASQPVDREMPCFLHRLEGRVELLWGATYRITEQFLKAIFGFVPPATGSLPIIHGRLDRSYLDGSSGP